MTDDIILRQMNDLYNQTKEKEELQRKLNSTRWMIFALVAVAVVLGITRLVHYANKDSCV